MAVRLHQPESSRAGVTLMEVLMSIFVVAVGLLGVAALIPVAGHQTESGERNDRIANVGRRSFREFDVRNMNRGENLRTGLRGRYRYFKSFDRVQSGFGGVGEPMSKAFCIDPFLTWFTQDLPGEVRAPQTLPADAPGVPTIPRVALGGPPPSARFDRQTTDDIFYFQDDLEFELPESANESATQVILTDASNAPAKRYAKGSYSWMAMLVPVDRFGSRNYTLYSIIFEGRNAYEPEIALPITAMPGQGMGGGDIEIPSNTVLSTGDWVMLARRDPALSQTDPSLQSGIGVFDWYRVVAADGVNVTLNGPDWIPSPAPGIAPDYLIIVPRVVGVYKKSVELDPFGI